MRVLHVQRGGGGGGREGVRERMREGRGREGEREGEKDAGFCANVGRGKAEGAGGWEQDEAAG